jgi:hypothetical protein
LPRKHARDLRALLPQDCRFFVVVLVVVVVARMSVRKFPAEVSYRTMSVLHYENQYENHVQMHFANAFRDTQRDDWGRFNGNRKKPPRLLKTLLKALRDSHSKRARFETRLKEY